MAATPPSDRAEGKRRRLLDAGLELLDELPYEEITVSTITSRATMARGLFFYYYGDKDAFFRYAVAAFLDRQRSTFAPNDPAAATDPSSWLTAEVGIFLDLMTAHPRAMRTFVEQRWADIADPSGHTMSDFTAARIRQVFGLPADDELIGAALLSWGLHCVDLVVRTQQRGSWDRQRVATVLIAELHAIVDVTTRSPRSS